MTDAINSHSRRMYNAQKKTRDEAAEAALVAAYRLGLGDAHRQAVMAGDQHAGLSASKVTDAICASIRALSTPTAAELMARIHTGEKDE